MALLSPLPAHPWRPSSSAFVPVYASLPCLSSPSHTHNLPAANLIQRRGCPSLRIAAFHTAAFSSPDTSLYQVLQIPKTATQSEIKAAYRRLARIYHPDVCATATDAGNMNEDPTKIFVQIKQAYDTLSDAQIRTQYDMRLGLEARIGSTSKSSTRIGRNWESDQCW